MFFNGVKYNVVFRFSPPTARSVLPRALRPRNSRRCPTIYNINGHFRRRRSVCKRVYKHVFIWFLHVILVYKPRITHGSLLT